MQRNLATLFHGEPVLATQEFLVHEKRQTEEQVAEAALTVHAAALLVLEQRVLHLVAQSLHKLGVVHVHV